jgi:hypothetical protein
VGGKRNWKRSLERAGMGRTHASKSSDAPSDTRKRKRKKCAQKVPRSYVPRSYAATYAYAQMHKLSAQVLCGYLCICTNA